MLHKSYHTGILPKLSNAVLLGILWVTRVFTKGGLCNMLGIPVFSIKMWPPCLRRPARRTSSLAGESGYAQAGGKLFQHPCLLDYVAFFATLGFIFNSSAYVV